jgi:hypothetical protein
MTDINTQAYISSHKSGDASVAEQEMAALKELLFLLIEGQEALLHAKEFISQVEPEVEKTSGLIRALLAEVVPPVGKSLAMGMELTDSKTGEVSGQYVIEVHEGGSFSVYKMEEDDEEESFNRMVALAAEQDDSVAKH